MRLPRENLTVAEQLGEFDQWLTAQLQRIKDSEKFTSELESLCDCIQHISPYLDNFSEPDACSVELLCTAVINASGDFIAGLSFFEDEQTVFEFYDAFFNLLFLVTGSTDNNLKNHFLIKLKEDRVSAKLPKRGTGKKTIKFRITQLPAVTKSDYIAKLLASYYVGMRLEYADITLTQPVFSLETYLQTYLAEYVGLILEDRDAIMQCWAICYSYMQLNRFSPDTNFGRYLLNSCTIFKVRGSVSASGGHVTEDLLRKNLQTIGLRPNIDYNLTDVVVGNQDVFEDGKRSKKTRAYDFILPFKVSNWQPKPQLFIQSQFYAGDSGSISHKVVDQTQSSRRFTLGKYPNARFVEYLDGAGYYASLRGDLEHMLTFDDTHSFVQVKSILTRLRREFQIIEFITPIEIEHAVISSKAPNREDVFNILLSEGYPSQEIERAEKVSIEMGYLRNINNKYEISEERIPIARRLLILDVAANNGCRISDREQRTGKFVLLPGFGANYGLLGSELSKLVCEAACSININVTDYETDIEWLIEKGVVSRL